MTVKHWIFVIMLFWSSLPEAASAEQKMAAPVVEVKGVVVLGLFRDPAGNSMGLAEMLDGQPKIP